MMTEPRNRGDRPEPASLFHRRREEVGELIAFARHAASIFNTRPPGSFRRFSDLLDELLPTDPTREARIARAIAMEPGMLRRLRARQLDPLRAPREAIAQLAQALRLDRDRETLRQLLAGDHITFGAVAARGGSDSDNDAWDAVDSALDRIAMDAPYRTSHS